MFKNIKIYLPAFFCMAMLLQACYKDIGNYGYNAINTLAIKLDSSYIGFYGKNISIKPLISPTMDTEANTYDTAKYKWEWSTIDAGALYATQRTVLATTRDLNKALSVPPGSYTLYFRITDKKTGVQWQATAKLTVTTSIYEGFLALCEVGGKTRLDMASYASGNYTIIRNVLDSVGSVLPVESKPLNITYCSQASLLTSNLANGIYISTGSGTSRIDPETFKWDATMGIQSDMLATVPASFTADKIAPSSGVNYMHNTDGNLYYYYRTFQLNWGTTLNVVGGEPNTFRASPYMAVSASGASSYGAVFYDVDKKRFIRHVAGAAACATMPTAMPYFNYTTGLDLTYMEYVNYSGGEVFSILRNPANDSSYLARFTFASSINQTYYAAITGTDFNKAERFAVSPDYGYIFYNVGGKIYEYDMGLKKSFLMIDKGSSQITTLQFQHFLGSGYTSGSGGRQILYNKLMVGSYDNTKPEGTGGTIDVYNVPQVNGTLTPFLSLTGFGKIQSLTYRER